MRHGYGERIREFELGLRSAALLLWAGPYCQGLGKELREARVIRIAGRRITIGKNPLRMLRQQSIVHLALKLRISRDFNGARQMGRAHFTTRCSRGREPD